MMWLVLILIAAVFFIVAVANVIIVPEKHVYIVEKLGKFYKAKEAGFFVRIPFFFKITMKVDMREQVYDFPPQPVITGDNVTMHIDTVVYSRVTDAKQYAYGVNNPVSALENLTATTLRNIIGEMVFDHTLTSRDEINRRMCEVLDEATDSWGIKVTRVELKNIEPPVEIKEAMERQMKAEREKRAAILLAEGEKESAIHRAQAMKIRMITEAEAHKESIRLHKEAEAEGVRLLKEAGLSAEQIVRLQSMDAFKKVADGQATKIIIPSDIQGMTGLVNALKESVSDPVPTAEEQKTEPLTEQR